MTATMIAHGLFATGLTIMVAWTVYLAVEVIRHNPGENDQ